MVDKLSVSIQYFCLNIALAESLVLTILGYADVSNLDIIEEQFNKLKGLQNSVLDLYLIYANMTIF